MKCLRCGDCCTRFDIVVLSKPAGVRCQHLNENNECRIYFDRPMVCRDHDYPAIVCPIGMQNKSK